VATEVLVRTFPVLVVLLGCSEPEGEECGSTQGFLFGHVTGPGTLTVYLHDAETGDLITSVQTDADGNYEFHTEEDGTYILSAAGGGCFSDDERVEVAACDEIETDLVVDDCTSVDKPNLYLYPATDTPMTVTLRHDVRQEVFASDPPYLGGWEGTAHPDGWFTPTGGERAPFLFYEMTVLPAQVAGMQREEAHCVGGDGAVLAMADLLGEYGFTAREQADFVDGWETDLPVRPSYAVYPQRRVADVVRVNLDPPLRLERLWLVVTDGAGCVPTARAPARFDRSGPHAVEWGVMLLGLR
jgi:hypothetical protein